MPLDFEPIRRFLPTPELRALLEEEIAALGGMSPEVDFGNVTVGMALGRLARTERDSPLFLALSKDDPSPLAPWVEAYGALLASTFKYGSYDLKRTAAALPKFGERAIGPLLALAGSEALAVRAAAYPALAKVVAKDPRLLHGPLLAALARGVADPSARVRLAAYEVLARQPEKARRALSEAAAGLEGKALELTNEALARLGAPVGEAEVASPPDPEDAQLLAGLVAAWAATRAPEIAELVELLSSQLPSPPLAGRAKTEKEAEWHVVARRRDPATLSSLLAAPWPAQWRDGADRLGALRGWPDPRIATALIELLEAQPYRSRASFALYRTALKDLTALRDARHLERLKKAGAALLARFAGYHYITEFREAASGQALADALRLHPPAPPPEGAPAVARARARLAGARSGAEERARTERDFLDRIGYGPEVYLLPRALGTSRFTVAYYEAGRAPQTEANVEVVLREGTPAERRYQFPVTLTHEGETLEVGSLVVEQPLE